MGALSGPPPRGGGWESLEIFQLVCGDAAPGCPLASVRGGYQSKDDWFKCAIQPYVTLWPKNTGYALKFLH